MRHCDYRVALELLPDYLLDQSLGLLVQVARCLIQNQDAMTSSKLFSYYCACKCQKLLFSMGQSVHFQICRQPSTLRNQSPETDGFEHIYQGLVRGDLGNGIQVESKSAWENKRILWKTDQAVSNGVSSNFDNVDPIDRDCTIARIYETEKCRQKRAFATANVIFCISNARSRLPPSSDANSNLLARFNLERYVFQSNGAISTPCIRP